MTKTPRQYMTEYLISFGRMFQLPEPPAEYIDAIYNALHAYQWTLKQFANVLNQLIHDEKYAETARFGKYPTINDFIRIKKQTESRPFYEALSAYLSGAFWEKDNVIALATPTQQNAITLAGGLKNLYNRATGDVPTPIYKLVDIVANNESESPEELIDTQHRIGRPLTIQQISAKK
ncbi:MAG: hypothetical protein IKA10_04570 [Oscillospiraceae bacterium]|nr:hypothetical protein [Oscillospiraceae bacterium]